MEMEEDVVDEVTDEMRLELDQMQQSCRRHLRSLELTAYHHVLVALRASGKLTESRKTSISTIRQMFNISEHRHLAEVRRVLSDHSLTYIADVLTGQNTLSDWIEVESRFHPILPRMISKTKMLANTLNNVVPLVDAKPKKLENERSVQGGTVSVTKITPEEMGKLGLSTNGFWNKDYTKDLIAANYVRNENSSSSEDEYESLIQVLPGKRPRAAVGRGGKTFSPKVEPSTSNNVKEENDSQTVTRLSRTRGAPQFVNSRRGRGVVRGVTSANRVQNAVTKSPEVKQASESSSSSSEKSESEEEAEEEEEEEEEEKKADNEKVIVSASLRGRSAVRQLRGRGRGALIRRGGIIRNPPKLKLKFPRPPLKIKPIKKHKPIVVSRRKSKLKEKPMDDDMMVVEISNFVEDGDEDEESREESHNFHNNNSISMKTYRSPPHQINRHENDLVNSHDDHFKMPSPRPRVNLDSDELVSVKSLKENSIKNPSPLRFPKPPTPTPDTTVEIHNSDSDSDIPSRKRRRKSPQKENTHDDDNEACVNEMPPPVSRFKRPKPSSPGSSSSCSVPNNISNYPPRNNSLPVFSTTLNMTNYNKKRTKQILTTSVVDSLNLHLPTTSSLTCSSTPSATTASSLATARRPSIISSSGLFATPPVMTSVRPPGILHPPRKAQPHILSSSKSNRNFHPSSASSNTSMLSTASASKCAININNSLANTSGLNAVPSSAIQIQPTVTGFGNQALSTAVMAPNVQLSNFATSTATATAVPLSLSGPVVPINAGGIPGSVTVSRSQQGNIFFLHKTAPPTAIGPPATAITGMMPVKNSPRTVILRRGPIQMPTRPGNVMILDMPKTPIVAAGTNQLPQYIQTRILPATSTANVVPTPEFSVVNFQNTANVVNRKLVAAIATSTTPITTTIAPSVLSYPAISTNTFDQTFKQIKPPILQHPNVSRMTFTASSPALSTSINQIHLQTNQQNVVIDTHSAQNLNSVQHDKKSADIVIDTTNATVIPVQDADVLVEDIVVGYQEEVVVTSSDADESQTEKVVSITSDGNNDAFTFFHDDVIEHVEVSVSTENTETVSSPINITETITNTVDPDTVDKANTIFPIVPENASNCIVLDENFISADNSVPVEDNTVAVESNVLVPNVNNSNTKTEPVTQDIFQTALKSSGIFFNEDDIDASNHFMEQDKESVNNLNLSANNNVIMSSIEDSIGTFHDEHQVSASIVVQDGDGNNGE